MALGLEPSRQIDWQPPATFSLTFPYKLACFAGFAQAHGFKRQQLGDREAIMDLGEVQVIHGNSRSVVGPLECQVGAFEAGQIFSGKGKEVVDLLCRTEANRTFKSASDIRSEEHTSELQSLMRISYAVFCLKKKTKKNKYDHK